MSTIEILLFATLKDVIGKPRLLLEMPTPTTVGEVRLQLGALHPQAQANIKAAIAAVNEEYAFDGDAVKTGDRVAFFPPVSGGAGERGFPEICQLADSALDLDELVAAITVPETGAICVFSGMVRGATQNDKEVVQTLRLEYEAYEPMAISKMRQVVQEIRQQWPLVQGIAIVQRVGRLDVGQNTILIVCGSGHRDQGCFEAARYGIDRLKEIVPVWKKEVGVAGVAWVEGEFYPTEDDRKSK